MSGPWPTARQGLASAVIQLATIPERAAWAFLEATVNELFQDAADGHGLEGDGYLAPLPSRTHRLMADHWRTTGGRMQPLGKYEMLLAFADAPSLDRAAQPYQDASHLIKLRNAVAHYQPESLPRDDPHKMERDLQGKFADNALMAGSGNSWWPDHALGHGCTAWAHRAAKALADLVSERLGIRPNYRRIADSGGHGQLPGEGRSG